MSSSSDRAYIVPFQSIQTLTWDCDPLDQFDTSTQMASDCDQVKKFDTQTASKWKFWMHFVVNWGGQRL